MCSMTYSKKYFLLFSTIIFMCAVMTGPVSAVFDPAVPEAPESLSFVRMKITGEEYVEIQNNTSDTIENLSIYALKAYNKVDPDAAGVAISSQSLPSLELEQGGRILLSTGIRPTCGASIAGKLSLSLVDGGGTLQIVSMTSVLNASSPTIVDSVSWSSSSSGAITLVPSFSKAPLTTYYRYGLEDGSFAWQKADQDMANSCGLIIPATSGNSALPIAVTPSEQQSGNESFSVSTAEEATTNTGSGIGSSNQGLQPVAISEVLPNPIGSGNDLTDEFIELHNPNLEAFDLSGYVLRSGVSTMRYYSFPAGTLLPAGSYAVYYSSETELLLSNTTGRVVLLDPDNQIVASTEVYRNAKDDQAWLQNNSLWQWTTTPTPGRINLVTAPVGSQKSTTAKSSTAKKTAKSAAVKAPKAAKAPKVKKEKKPKTEKTQKYSATPTAATVEARPIQSRVIAIIALIALLYGAYEYRGDLANKYQQCRRHLVSWRPNRR